MNEKKLSIIKKFLDVDSWTLREDKTKYPYSIFIFNGDGKLIMDFDKIGETGFYHFSIDKKIRMLFGFKYQEIGQLIGLLVEEHFGDKKEVKPSVIISQISSRVENHFKEK